MFSELASEQNSPAKGDLCQEYPDIGTWYLSKSAFSSTIRPGIENDLHEI